MNDHGYKYIIMWGRELGSYPDYIQQQCDKALQDKAPLNAIYNDDRNGRWQTTNDLTNNGIRVRMGLDPLPPEHPVILRAYNGEPAGTQHGYPEFSFASLPAAVRWASDKGLSDRVILVDYAFGRFSEAVTVRLLPEEKPVS